MKVELADFIFCDDIRKELGNKFSIMGIYSNKLRVSTSDSNIKVFRIPVSVFMRFSGTEVAAEKEFSFKLAMSYKGKNIAGVDGSFTFGTEPVCAIPITRLQFEVSEPGQLEFKLTVSDGEEPMITHSQSLNIIIEPPGTNVMTQ